MSTVKKPVRWSYHAFAYGLRCVILDENGQHLGSHLPKQCGPLLAKAPAMLHALREIQKMFAPGSEAHRIAGEMIEELRADYQRARLEGG